MRNFPMKKIESKYQNRLKSHPMPPVSNGCKFSLLAEAHTHCIAFRSATFNGSIFAQFHLQPQNGILSSYSSRAKRVVQTYSSRYLTKVKCTLEMSRELSADLRMKNRSTRSPDGRLEEKSSVNYSRSRTLWTPDSGQSAEAISLTFRHGAASAFLCSKKWVIKCKANGNLGASSRHKNWSSLSFISQMRNEEK